MLIMPSSPKDSTWKPKSPKPIFNELFHNRFFLKTNEMYNVLVFFFNSPVIRRKIILRFEAFLLPGCKNVAPLCFCRDLCRQTDIALLSILATHKLTAAEAPLFWGLMVYAIGGSHASIFCSLPLISNQGHGQQCTYPVLRGWIRAFLSYR